MIYSIIPILIIVVVIVVIVRIIFNFSSKKKSHNNHGGHSIEDRDSFLQVFFSKEDMFTQITLCIGYAYLGLSLFSINQKLGLDLETNVLMLVIGLIGLLLGYFKKVLFLAVPGIAITVGWFIYKLYDMVSFADLKSTVAVSSMILFSIFLYLVSYYHSDKFKRFSFIFSTIGMLILTILLFSLSTREGLYIFSEKDAGFFWSSWPVSSVIILFLAIIAGQLVRFMGKKISIREGITLIVYVLISILLLFIPTFDPFIPGSGNYIQELSSPGIAIAIFFNAVIFIHFALFVIIGYLRKSTRLINIGGALIFITVIVKYFTWFWTLFDRSIFFIIAGILLVSLGWLLERSRKKLISSMGTQSITN